MTMINNMF